MKTRIRWYGLSSKSISLRDVAARMKLFQYGKSRGSGFLLSEVRQAYIKGVYLERHEWDDTIDDPVQGPLEVHKVELRQTQFRISRSPPEVELRNPARSTLAFAEALGKCMGEAVAFVELSVDPGAWLLKLEQEVTGILVVEVTTTRFSLGSEASAIVEVSGTRDVRKHLSKVSASRDVKIGRVGIYLPSPYNVKAELSLGGRALILGSCDTDRVVDLLRATLCDAE